MLSNAGGNGRIQSCGFCITAGEKLFGVLILDRAFVPSKLQGGLILEFVSQAK